MKTIYFLLFLPFFAGAFSIDSMVKFSDKNDCFVVSGNKKDREYVYVTLSELISDKNNRRHEVFYDASNVMQWPISAEPSEIIITSGEQVRVKINKNYARSGNDRIFGIMFNPDSLNGESSNKVNVPFGYKAWLIVPGTDPLTGTVDVKTIAKKNKYVIENNTNKVIDVRAEYCHKGEKKNCKSRLFARPYSEKIVEINSNGTPVEFIFNVGSGDNSKIIKRKIL